MPRRRVHPLWGSLALRRDAMASLQEQIVCFFREAIADGRLQAGASVPSSRQLVAEFDISRTTAVEAYNRLVDEGYFVTRRGAGVFVSATPPESFQLRAPGAASVPLPLPGFAPPDARHYHLPLAPGMPALDKFPWTTWARLTTQVCRDQPLSAVGYGDPQGELSLREAIVEYLGAARGIRCGPEQVVIIGGTEQTLAFAMRQVTRPGDAVWIEDPGYPYILSALREAGREPVAVPVNAEGIDVEQGVARAPDARLAVVSPSHQYPTGVTMTLAQRKALIAWSVAAGAWIFENDIDGDYRYVPRPVAPVYALAGGERVIYGGSLSKPLAPGLRTNYLVVPRYLVPRLALSPTLVPLLNQLVLARFSAQGYLASHMSRMRSLYARRRALLLRALHEQVGDYLDVTRVPDAGLRVAASLLTRADDVQLAARGLQAGIKVDPLSVCYRSLPRKSGLIIGFASTPEDRIDPAVRALASVLSSQLDT